MPDDRSDDFDFFVEDIRISIECVCGTILETDDYDVTVACEDCGRSYNVCVDVDRA